PPPLPRRLGTRGGRDAPVLLRDRGPGDEVHDVECERHAAARGLHGQAEGGTAAVARPKAQPAIRRQAAASQLGALPPPRLTKLASRNLAVTERRNRRLTRIEMGQSRLAGSRRCTITPKSSRGESTPRHQPAHSSRRPDRTRRPASWWRCPTTARG